MDRMMNVFDGWTDCSVLCKCAGMHVQVESACGLHAENLLDCFKLCTELCSERIPTQDCSQVSGLEDCCIDVVG